MAAGVNVKMGVEGVSQFKNNMSQARQAVKTLDAQLALTEKQFKASGDAESYMTEKTELLKAKLEQQKSTLDNAQKALDSMTKNGVDRASKAYQEMYRQVLKAKGELLDTENALNDVADAGDQAADAVSDMGNQLDQINRGVNVGNIVEGIDTITNGMQTAITKAWKLGESIVNATLGAGRWADELDETATKYEMKPEQLYRMRQVADFIDTDVDTIISAQDKLAKNRSQAGKEFMGALAKLEIDPHGKTNLDLFWEAGEAIMKLGENEDKTYYAQQIFGKSWRELIPLFKEGRKAYDDLYNNKTSWIGDENFKALTELDDQSQELNNEWETLQSTFMATLAGPMKGALETVTDLMKEFNKYLQSDKGKETMAQLGDTIAGLVEDLVNVDPEQVVQTVVDAIDKLKGGLEWIKNNKEGVKTAVTGFIAAWAGLTVAKGVTTALQLITGLKGFTGMGAAAAGNIAGTSWAGAFASAAMKAAPFLAFLYTLLNPSSTSDAIGDNTLIDKEGNLTKEAEKYGYKKDKNGEVVPSELWSNEKDETVKETKAKTVDLTVEHMGKVLGGAIEDTKKNIVEGASGLYRNFTEGLAENAKNFDKDLRENVITSTMVSLGTNSILYWNDIHEVMLEAEKAAEEAAALEQAELDAIAARQKSEPTANWEYGDDWSIDEIMADMARTVGSDSEATRQANSELNAATTNLQGMPAVIAAAIESSMSQIKVYIDGYTAGQAIGPYLNPGYGGMVMKMTK